MSINKVKLTRSIACLALMILSSCVCVADLARADTAVLCGGKPLSADGISTPVRAIYKTNRWRYLSHTMDRLRRGDELQVVTLGDSIVNDTFGPQTGAGGYHTSFAWGMELIAAQYQARIWTVVAVRGSTGAWWYREPGRVQTYVLDFNPDLVLIGGISNHDDIDALRDVIQQIRAARPDTEIVLMTDAVNLTSMPVASTLVLDLNADTYRARLAALADEVGAGFIDMRGSYDEFILETNRLYPAIAYDFFQRDSIHANANGSAVLRAIVTSFFSPDTPCPIDAPRAEVNGAGATDLSYCIAILILSICSFRQRCFWLQNIKWVADYAVARFRSLCSQS